MVGSRGLSALALLLEHKTSHNLSLYPEYNHFRIQASVSLPSSHVHARTKCGFSPATFSSVPKSDISVQGCLIA